MTLALSNAELEDALLLNARQDQAIYNPSPAVDSLCEHLVEIARHSTGAVREHAIAALRLARCVRDDNRSERGHIEAAPVVPVRRAPGVKAAARRLRDPLAVLCNPVIKGRARETALAEVAAVIAEFPEGVLRSVSLRHELRVSKFTMLCALLDEARARR